MRQPCSIAAVAACSVTLRRRVMRFPARAGCRTCPPRAADAHRRARPAARCSASTTTRPPRSAPSGPVAAPRAFGGLAGFEGDHVGAGGPDRQRGADPGEHVGAVEVAVQQQHLDQRPGAAGVTVGFAGGGPKRVVLGGERLGGAGLGQRGRPGQRAGFAVQDLQIVVQIKDFGALADRALMPGHHRVAVIDDHRRGRQLHPQPMPDEPGRHRVLIAAHHHLGVAVHPRRQRQRGVERLARQRAQQRLLERPVWPTLLARLPIRRASSASSAASSSALSSSIESTTGIGTQWLRRNRPPSPSTPPFSWLPSWPGWQ